LMFNFSLLARVFERCKGFSNGHWAK
jgi:hypothetical protein